MSTRNFRRRKSEEARILHIRHSGPGRGTKEEVGVVRAPLARGERQLTSAERDGTGPRGDGRGAQ